MPETWYCQDGHENLMPNNSSPGYCAYNPDYCDGYYEKGSEGGYSEDPGDPDVCEEDYDNDPPRDTIFEKAWDWLTGGGDDDYRGGGGEADVDLPGCPENCPGPHQITLGIVPMWFPASPTEYRLIASVATDSSKHPFPDIGGNLTWEVTKGNMHFAESGGALFDSGLDPNATLVGWFQPLTAGERKARLAAPPATVKLTYTLNDFEVHEATVDLKFPELELEGEILGPDEVFPEPGDFSVELRPLNFAKLPSGTFTWRSQREKVSLAVDGFNQPEVTGKEIQVASHEIAAKDVLEVVFRPDGGEYELLFEHPVRTAGVQADVDVLSLYMEGSRGKSNSHTHEKTNKHGSDSFHFAPGVDTITIRYSLSDPGAVRPPARLELTEKGGATVLWTWELSGAELEAGDRTLSWDGSTPESEGLPAGLVTLEKSPYKLRLVYPEVVGTPDAWTYFEVQSAGMKVRLGPKEMVPSQFRAAVSILKGRGGIPDTGSLRRVSLPWRCLKKMKAQQLDDHAFSRHEADWGGGPEIPIVAELMLRAHDGSEVSSPKAIGEAHFYWDFDYASDERVEEFETYLQASSYAHGVYVKRRGGSRSGKGWNCPVACGGRRDGLRILPLPKAHDPKSDCQSFAKKTFPFSVEPAVRSSALISASNRSGSHAGLSGIVFKPSRIAGDAYSLRVYHLKDDAARQAIDVADPPGVAKAKAKDHYAQETGLFQVWRRVRISRYLKKKPRIPSLTDDQWQEFKDEYQNYFVEVVGVPTTAQNFDSQDWNKRLDDAVLGSGDPMVATAIHDGNQYAGSGDDSYDPKKPDQFGGRNLYFRSYEEYRDAWREIRPHLPEEWQSARLPSNSYAASAKDDWTIPLKAMFGDIPKQSGSGITIVHTDRLENVSGGTSGWAPDFNLIRTVDGGHGIAFLYLSQSKDPIPTLIHEVGHVLCLPHTFAEPPSHQPMSHHLCVMSYHDDARAFCGVCVMRLRGWSVSGIKSS